jgi:uncharacterized protein (DUF924 family)
VTGIIQKDGKVVEKPDFSAEQADEVLQFWFHELDQKDWFAPSRAVDQEISQRFRGLYDRLVGDADLRRQWLRAPETSLALILVLDQFPRNMFRGQPQSFAADDMALAAARQAIAAGHDLATALQRRAFYYLPFEHSENWADQEEAVRLVKERADVGESLKYAELHRDIISQFGRFPHRNKILGRSSTPEEEKYLQNGGHNFGAVAQES